MMGKKLVAVLFGLLMIGMAFSAGSAFAGETVTVILVSDNAADKAIAEYLANLTGAIVVTTTWGVYNPNVTAEILSYAPDQVIIIGGPEAVVDEYVADLEEYNVTVYRWWGTNRYETNLAVIGNASKLFGIKFNASVVVAGNDSLAIQTALKLAIENRAMIIYVNQSTNVSKLMERFQVREMVMVQSKASKKVMEKVEKELRKCNCRAERVQANVTKEQVEQIMEQVRERLMAVEEIANMTNSTQLREQVKEMLQLMEKVNQSLQAGNVTEAYALALQLQVKSEFALKSAHMEFKKALIQKSQLLALEMKLQRIEAKVRMLEISGFNVSKIMNVLVQLQMAIRNGDYTKAKHLICEIDNMIEEIYKKYKKEKTNTKIQQRG